MTKFVYENITNYVVFTQLNNPNSEVFYAVAHRDYVYPQKFMPKISLNSAALWGYREKQIVSKFSSICSVLMPFPEENPVGNWLNFEVFWNPSQKRMVANICD